MTTPDFNATFLVDQSPEEVFNAINNVRGWWSELVEGGTAQLNDEFTYKHRSLHYSRQKLVELIPGKKVVWLVTESKLSFMKSQSEWTGTKIIFDISKQGNKTRILFKHLGLDTGCECFEACSNGWHHYLQNSLLPLITTGEGQPDALSEQ